MMQRPISPLAQRLSGFAQQLHAAVPADNFLSTQSLQLCLALIGCGAHGETLAEMQQVLGWAQTADWANDLAALFAEVRATCNGNEPVVASANRVYAKCAIQAEYARAVQGAFSADVVNMGTADEINEFVADKTRDKIKELVTEDDVAKSALIAVNALYFKGALRYQFELAKTRVAPFHGPGGDTADCHLMQLSHGHDSGWQYYEDAERQCILLPYRGADGEESELAALIVLPRAQEANPMAGVQVAAACELLRTQTRRKGTILLPRFDLESTTELQDAVQGLGLRRALTGAGASAGEFSAADDWERGHHRAPVGAVRAAARSDGRRGDARRHRPDRRADG